MNSSSVVLLVLRVAGIATAVVALVSRADCAFVFGTCSIRNLLGYFTIESAILFTATLACTLVLAVLRAARPGWLDGVRITVACYVIVSGFVFAVLMSTAGYTGAEFLVPLSSRVLHFVLPAFAILDVMLDPPAVGMWRMWVVLVFPAGWLVVTVIRGAAVGWYPYFFVSPEAVGGYPQLAAYAAGLAALLLAASWVVTTLGRSSLARVAGAESARSRHAGLDSVARGARRGVQ